MQGGFFPPHCGFLQPREKSGPNGALHRQHCVQDRCCHSEVGDHGAGQTEEKGGAGKAAGRGGRGKWSSATQTLRFYQISRLSYFVSRNLRGFSVSTAVNQVIV